MTKSTTDTVKPLLRGHFHQAAFFFALGACAMLISQSRSSEAAIALTIYSLSLTGLLGTSALYHRVFWSPTKRVWMKRLDHSAIFILIAGTGTPLFLLALEPTVGRKLLVTVWAAALAGILQSVFWVKAPKWISALLCVAAGWIIVPYFNKLQSALGPVSVALILAGGIVYSTGALIYALKWPKLSPRIFSYHELFHILVIIGATLHFIAIARL